jgi:N-sulfoglucosamine sulfohydrolase
LSADDVEPLPFVGVNTPRIRQHTADYYNCMQRLDVMVGLLLEVLRDQGKEDNTLVLFTTDHGAQFSRGKCTCYEGGLRIPMIARWPGRIPPGRVVDAFVSQIDVLPTVLNAVGEEGPRHVAGSSLLPLISGGASGWRDRVFAEWTSCHAPLYYPQRAIRDGRYKLIVTYRPDRPSPCAQIPAGTGPSGKHIPPGTLPGEVQATHEAVRRAYAVYDNPPPEELYDLRKDPWEFHNLADDPSHATGKERLRRELLQWQEQTGDRLRDAAVLDRLNAEHDDIVRRYYTVGDRVPEGFVYPYLDYLGAEV